MAQPFPSGKAMQQGIQNGGVQPFFMLAERLVPGPAEKYREQNLD
jgi:hypothetical protein